MISVFIGICPAGLKRFLLLIRYLKILLVFGLELLSLGFG